ncbi:MAG: aldo/keto reductase [Ilumatobacteraceae bacterium]
MTADVVGRLGLGTAPLGNLFTSVTDDDAAATVEAAWDAGIRWFDTAPQYGHGVAEVRLGRALSGLPRDQYVLASKVGRLLRRTEGPRPPTSFCDVPDVDPVHDFSRDGVLRSLEESLERLGTDRLDVVYVHDPDDHERIARDEAFPALFELRDQGVVRQVGCGMNQSAMLQRFVADLPLDGVLMAGRWTLLDRSGADLLDDCAARGVNVSLGGVFNSGLLADPSPTATFDYATAPTDLVEKARAVQGVCAEHGVSLPQAAIRFALRHPAVTTVLFGARSAAEVRDDVGWASDPVPDALWADVDRVVAGAAG